MSDETKSTTTGAVISDCGNYRYLLTREISEPLFSRGPACCFVMLNPSTADAQQDDPTGRRCMGFARREGCVGLSVVNLYGLRATKPASYGLPLTPLDRRTTSMFARLARLPI